MFDEEGLKKQPFFAVIPGLQVGKSYVKGSLKSRVFLESLLVTDFIIIILSFWSGNINRYFMRASRPRTSYIYLG